MENGMEGTLQDRADTSEPPALSPRTRNERTDMGAIIIMSGGQPFERATQRTAQALNDRFRFSGTLAAANDRLRVEQQHGPAGRTMRDPELQLGIVSILSKMLRGLLQAHATGETIRRGGLDARPARRA